MGIEYHYERQKHEYEVGEVVHNLNGNDYKVLEKYHGTQRFVVICKRKGGGVDVGTNEESCGSVGNS